jgi:RNA polymerase sigma factor (sigma-70 family)
VVVEPYFELSATLNDSLHRLDAQARDAFILTELRGLTEREAADVLDTSQPTVHRRAEAARNYIREELIAA